MNTNEEDPAAESSPAPGKRPMCAQCERPCRVCWCDALPRPRISIATQIVILQHPDECRRAIRTARMLELGLSPANCVVHRGRKFPAKNDEDRCGLKSLFAEKTAYILFPGPEALKLTEASTSSERFTEDVKTVIILDGTWDQAKKMFVRSPDLQKIKRLQLDLR